MFNFVYVNFHSMKGDKDVDLKQSLFDPFAHFCGIAKPKNNSFRAVNYTEYLSDVIC